jgi:hypothetical protein
VRLSPPSSVAAILTTIFCLPALAQTTPATTPAAAAQAAKSALSDFYHLMYDANPKALDLLVFTDPQSEKAARITAQLALAQQRVRLAAIRAFGNAANELSLGVTDKDRQQFEKDLQQATVSIHGPAATIKLPSGDAFILVQKNGPAGEGVWKLEFDKTQTNMGPLPKDADLPALAAQTDSLNTLAVDLTADAQTPDPAKKRIQSLPDLKLRLQQLTLPELVAPPEAPAPVLR